MARSTFGAGASAARQSRSIRSAHRRARHRVALRRAPLVAGMASLVGWVAAAASASAGFGAGAGIVVGATLTGGSYTRSLTADRWAKGAKGERRTARSLALARGWVALHDRAIPGSAANLDHILFGGGGVVYLDTKTWTSTKSRARFDADGRLWYGRYPQDRALRTVRWEADQAQEALGVGVQAVISVHGQPHLPRRGTVVDGVTVVPAEALREWLDARPRVLDESRVAALVALAENALPPYVH
ncbi:NERD domain-containing protein (plasmid) [Embleya sp. NBC_00888]|uniref:nuclease-related domain-containing protein n=1 Tax=Embleya sp. NBC_00888 TaxID=2975960 RepID=UPI002F913EBE|nr:NERD domain-containing protein [Embleya sp. NBC_00888]